MRADERLVALGLAESRNQARRLIEAGAVTLDGQVLRKPARSVGDASTLVVTAPLRFVSRGGDKLAGFLDAFDIEVNRAFALDAGASTGGFTDCLLQRGAQGVVCVDVGHGQLHPRLARDHRVVNIEGVNVRELDTAALPREAFDRVVADLSFISLTRVLPALWGRVAARGCAIALIKPQFEAGKAVMDACGGVLRDPAVQAQCRDAVLAFAAEHLPGCDLIGHCESPITGTDGNREFLAGWRRLSA